MGDVDDFEVLLLTLNAALGELSLSQTWQNLELMIKEEPHWLQNITTIDYSMKIYNILNYIAYIKRNHGTMCN